MHCIIYEEQVRNRGGFIIKSMYDCNAYYIEDHTKINFILDFHGKNSSILFDFNTTYFLINQYFRIKVKI